MFECRLRRADHSRRYAIHPATPSGWEVLLEEDRELVRCDLYQDWHRVERALESFKREVGRLRESGWLLASEASR